MSQVKTGLAQVFTALALVLCILCGTILLSRQVESSTVYRQSLIIGSVFSQKSVGVGDVLKNSKNMEMLFKFAGAVTGAYINFELIPIYEADTFVAVFESANDNITVDAFTYHRKNLVIDGTAETGADYEAFAGALRDQGHFESVSGDHYTATDNTVKFKIVCVLDS